MISISSFTQTDRTMAVAKTAGFDNVAMLREAAASLSDPSELAELFDLDRAELNQLLREANLSSIEGLGKTYLDLLRAAGIGSLDVLSKFDPFELHALVKAAAKGHRVARVPNRATIEYWIEQAQALLAHE